MLIYRRSASSAHQLCSRNCYLIVYQYYYPPAPSITRRWRRGRFGIAISDCSSPRCIRTIVSSCPATPLTGWHSGCRCRHVAAQYAAGTSGCVGALLGRWQVKQRSSRCRAEMAQVSEMPLAAAALRRQLVVFSPQCRKRPPCQRAT